MPEASNVHPIPIRTSLVCSECGAPGSGSCRCGAPYVSPGERAAAAVAANPGMSDRAIAEEQGVGANTVRRARSTAPRGAVGPRTGRDGRTRRVPTPRARRPETVEREERVAALMDDGNPTAAEVAAELGIPCVRVATAAMEHVRIAREAEARLLDQLDVDPQTLAPSARARLDAATRAMERRLNAQYAERMRGLDEEVRQRLLERTAERLRMLQEMEAAARQTETTFRRMIDYRRIFTSDEFRTILMCLHPDGQRTPERLAEAFRLFNDKKLQLTGERR